MNSPIQTKSLKVAICGIRGIPACYGGFETFAEELSSRLAARGHQVRVYGRRHVIGYRDRFYKGVEIKLLPAPRHKYLETPVHSLLTLLSYCGERMFSPKTAPEVLLVCNAANSPFLFLTKLFRVPVAVNVDGIERLRGKWNALGRLWYRLGERCSVLFANRIIADADVIANYYAEQYGAQSTIIAYGYREGDVEFAKRKIASHLLEQRDSEVLRELGLKTNGYLLYVSRLEPENNAHRVIKAYQSLPETDRRMPLVIVGDAPYAKDYIRGLHEMAGPSVIFAGFRFGQSYIDLQESAYAYIQATEVGGTHPALVESMGFGNCIIANGTPENSEVVADTALLYAQNDDAELARCLSLVLSDPQRVLAYRGAAHERATRVYHWEKICSDYEKLFYELLAQPGNVEERSAALRMNAD